MASNLTAHPIIEELRVEFFKKGLSHEKLSTLTGISTSAISRRLTATTAATVDELTAFADAIDADLVIALAPRTPAVPTSPEAVGAAGVSSRGGVA